MRGHLSGLDLDEIELVRVLGDIQHSRGLAGLGVELDQAVEFQQTQRAGLIGGVVRDGDGRAVRVESSAVLFAGLTYRPIGS